MGLFFFWRKRTKKTYRVWSADILWNYGFNLRLLVCLKVGLQVWRIPSPRGSGFSVGRKPVRWRSDVTPPTPRIIQDRARVGASPQGGIKTKVDCFTPFAKTALLASRLQTGRINNSFCQAVLDLLFLKKSG